MGITKEGLGLSALGIVILALVFVLVFNGLNAPVNAVWNMLIHLVWGIIIGFSILFVLVGLLMAFS